MKNVVLIGATGFVGSALLNELVMRGHKVTAIVRNMESAKVWASMSSIALLLTLCGVIPCSALNFSWICRLRMVS